MLGKHVITVLCLVLGVKYDADFNIYSSLFGASGTLAPQLQVAVESKKEGVSRVKVCRSKNEEAIVMSRVYLFCMTASFAALTLFSEFPKAVADETITEKIEELEDAKEAKHAAKKFGRQVRGKDGIKLLKERAERSTIYSFGVVETSDE